MDPMGIWNFQPVTFFRDDPSLKRLLSGDASQGVVALAIAPCVTAPRKLAVHLWLCQGQRSVVLWWLYRTRNKKGFKTMREFKSWATEEAGLGGKRGLGMISAGLNLLGPWLTFEVFRSVLSCFKMRLCPGWKFLLLAARPHSTSLWKF